MGNVSGPASDSSFARQLGGKFEKSVRVRPAAIGEKFLRWVRFPGDDGFVPRVGTWFCWCVCVWLMRRNHDVVRLRDVLT
jgi:hypothetical protein